MISWTASGIPLVREEKITNALVVPTMLPLPVIEKAMAGTRRDRQLDCEVSMEKKEGSRCPDPWMA